MSQLVLLLCLAAINPAHRYTQPEFEYYDRVVLRTVHVTQRAKFGNANNKTMWDEHYILLQRRVGVSRRWEVAHTYRTDQPPEPYRKVGTARSRFVTSAYIAYSSLGAISEYTLMLITPKYLYIETREIIFQELDEDRGVH